MINLVIDNTSEVITTLYSNSTNIVNPYFTWMIQHKVSLQETVFYQEDHSVVPWYYNAFTLSVSTTQSGLTAGVVSVPYGKYNYFIYQMNNPYDLNLNNAVGLVEQGILHITGTFSPITSYTASFTYSQYTNLNRI